MNIEISLDSPYYEEMISYASAGKAIGDVLLPIYRYLPLFAQKGYIIPLNTDLIRSAGLDVDDPEQVDYHATQLSKQIDGENVWSAVFSGEHTLNNMWGYGIVFNKALLDKAGYPADTMYQLVRDGRWTWAKFEEICRGITKTDWEGRSVLSYVVNAPRSGLPDIATFVPIVSRGDDGKWRSNVDTQEFRSAVDFFDKILASEQEEKNEFSSLILFGNPAGTTGKDIFCWGGLGMLSVDSSAFAYDSTMINNSSMADDYGFIPMPKSSEEAEYVSVYEPYGFCIESAHPDPQRSAYILSELSKILNDPSGLEVNIRGFMCDDESTEMIMEYVRPNSVMPIMADVRTITNELAKELCYRYEGTFYYPMSMKRIVSTFHPQLQAALDELFEQ